MSARKSRKIFTTRRAPVSFRSARRRPSCKKRWRKRRPIPKGCGRSARLWIGPAERLRPKGLAELGLESALKSLVASWSLGHPEVELRLVMPHDLSSLDETTALTAYR